MILADDTTVPDTVGRSHALDGLRGIAACAVVFYHAILHNDLTLLDRVLYQPIQTSATVRDFLTKVALIVSNGEVAVFVFFVLSGAVLRISLDRRPNDSRLTTCVAFAGARLLRLYPPLVACLLLFYALSRLGILGFPAFTVSNLIANATLWAIQMHGPSSTVQAEVIVIPFILAAWFLRRECQLPGLIICLIYGLLAIESSGWMVFHLPNMHAYLLPFMAGMLAAEPAMKPIMRQVSPTYWWIAFAALILCRTFSPHTSIGALVAMVLAAAFLVSGLMHGQRGLLSSFLESSSVQFAGRVSFSLYLFNVPALDLIWSITDRMAWPKTHALEAGLLIGVASIALALPMAWASQRWIERPSITAGRWFTQWVRSRAASGRPTSDQVLAG